MDALIDLYRKYSGQNATSFIPINNSASNRKYYRLFNDKGESVIGVIGTLEAENRAFIGLAKQFRAKKLNVPEIYAVSDDFLCYLQEDLGDISLFSILGDVDPSLLRTTISALPEIQIKGSSDLDYSICFPKSEFDRRTILWDLNYFKYDFLKPSGLEFDEDKMEDDFETFVSILENPEFPTGFMYRDFQSRNVMVKDNQPWFIDFQGGRKGPVYYDLASFVYQAKAGFDSKTRDMLINCYYEALQKFIPVSKEDFDRAFPYFVLFRCLQTLGAYGFRGLVERKANFIASVPAGIRNLHDIMGTYDYPQLPYLCSCLKRLTSNYEMPIIGEKGSLTVRIYSFSYKKGIPNDYSGNGGGFVFDCRAIHNPGKYPQYRNSTGMDADVKAFLENDGEIIEFMTSVYALADKAVKRYIDRGFSDLMFCFGCTGGQHRSVYGAEALAKHLRESFPQIRICLFHREQNIDKISESGNSKFEII